MAPTISSAFMRFSTPLQLCRVAYRPRYSARRNCLTLCQVCKVAVLPGDGIGPEISKVAVSLLKAAGDIEGVKFQFTNALIGGAAIDAAGSALPEETLSTCKASDAVLLAAIGG